MFSAVPQPVGIQSYRTSGLARKETHLDVGGLGSGPVVPNLKYCTKTDPFWGSAVAAMRYPKFIASFGETAISKRGRSYDLASNRLPTWELFQPICT